MYPLAPVMATGPSAGDIAVIVDDAFVVVIIPFPLFRFAPIFYPNRLYLCHWILRIHFPLCQIINGVLSDRIQRLVITDDVFVVTALLQSRNNNHFCCRILSNKLIRFDKREIIWQIPPECLNREACVVPLHFVSGNLFKRGIVVLGHKWS